MIKVNEFLTAELGSDYVAKYIANKINEFQPNETKPFVLGLPTGSSPEGVYRKLIELNTSKKVSFQHVVTFNMDEYCGLSPSDEQSYHHFMHTKFFDHVDIKPENIHILNGLSKNRAEECANYEEMIAKYGPFQIFMGGIGKEGHIAFNESGSSRNSKTREIQLAQSTIEANSRFFNNDISKVPKSALTVGISTILDNSKEVIILAFGTSKANVVSKTINDNIDSKTPSTFLREHSNVTLVVDKSSALLLHKK